MDIGWMSNAELAEAIPPYYTEFIGLSILARRVGGCCGAATRGDSRRRRPLFGAEGEVNFGSGDSRHRAMLQKSLARASLKEARA